MAPDGPEMGEILGKVTVNVDRLATGGEGVGRLDDGMVVFVPETAPGDVAAVELVERKKRFARGRLVGVTEPGELRVDPPCSYVASGCGGCDWQHLDPAQQLELKAGIVTDALQRIGRIEGGIATADVPLESVGRTTVRVAAASGGRLGFRKRASHDVVPIGTCAAAHPLVDELIGSVQLGTASEATIRVGARTGERLVIADPSTEGVEVPEGVGLIGVDELEAGDEASIHEEIAGRRWQVSARSFFQTSPVGAERLVELVRAAVADGPNGPLADLYSGVGLFAGTVGEGRDVIAVESSASSCADARVNLGDAARIVQSKVERWTPEPAAIVVADPARAGLGKQGVGVVGATGAELVVLISCDSGALGRDAGLLQATGLSWQQSTVVDMFPMTSHVEVVSTFRRA